MPAARESRDEVVRAFVADADRLKDDADTLSRSLAWMSHDERARFDRFRHEPDRLMFAMGRLMARTLVARELGVEPDAWHWREGPHGRPEIDGPPTDLHFNLSHSASLVACVLGRGQALGVDVEHLERRVPDRAIVTRYCSPTEAADVEAQGNNWCERFLTYWTLKEAYLKARGLGIAVPLSDVSFDLSGAAPRVRFEGSLAGTDARWMFHLWRPTPAHVAALAVHTPGGRAPRVEIAAYD